MVERVQVHPPIRIAAAALALVLAGLGGALAASKGEAKGPEPAPPAPQAAPATPATSEAAPAEDERGLTRIVGGRKAEDGAWPSQVEIYAPDPAGRGRFRSHCGGTVIAADWVLTAAHCFVAPAGPGARRQAVFAHDILVAAGQSRLPTVITQGDETAKKAIRVKEVIYHPDFEPGSFANDVALVQLQKPAGVPAMALMGVDDRAVDLAGVAATVIGWGFLRETASFDIEALPTNLQEVELPVIDTARCRAAYADGQLRGNSIDERNLCAGFAAGGRDACRGDSGGPLMIHAAGGGWVQAGVVSWGEGCGRKNRFGVYTRVAQFEPWIRQVVGTGLAPLARASGEPRLSADATPGIEATVVAGLTPATAPSGPVFEMTTPSSLARAAAALERGDRALVIGVDGYAEPLGLTGSLADAKAVAAMLTDVLGYRREQVLVLTNEKATRANILAALDAWLVQGTTAGSRVFLYYSGQGFQTRLFPSLRDGLPGPVIAPWDIALVRDGDGRVLDVTGPITSADLRRVTARLADRVVTAVFDATPVTRRGVQRPAQARGDEAASIRAVEARVELAPSLADVTLREGGEGGIDPSGRMVVWTGAAFDQWALVDPRGAEPMGLFTRAWVDGMRASRLMAGRDGDQRLTDLLAAVRTSSERACEELGAACRLGVTPQLFAGAAARATALTAMRAVGAETRATPAIENSAEVRFEAVEATVVGTQVRVTTRKPGWLLVVRIGADGRLTQLWPDVEALRKTAKGQRDANRIDPAKPVTITLDRKAVVGEAALVAVVADRAVQAIDLPEAPSNGADLAAGVLFLHDHVKSLAIPDVKSGTFLPATWSFASTVVRAAAP